MFSIINQLCSRQIQVAPSVEVSQADFRRIAGIGLLAGLSLLALFLYGSIFSLNGTLPNLLGAAHLLLILLAALLSLISFLKCACSSRISPVWTVGSLLLLIFLILYNSSSPPIIEEVLSQNLYLAKIWSQQSKISTLNWHYGSYLPALGVVLQTLLLKFFDEQIIPIYSLLLSLLVAGFCMQLVRRLEETIEQQLLSFLLALSVPLQIFLISGYFSDVLTQFFLMLYLLYLTDWYLDYKPLRSLIGAGLALGLLYGSGLQAIFLVSLFIFLACFFLFSKRISGKNFLLAACIIPFFALVLAAPWLVRNALLETNPFFPVFNELLGDGNSPIRYSIDSLLEILPNYKSVLENWENYLLAPLRLIFNFNVVAAAPMLSPLFILLLPASFIRTNTLRVYLLTLTWLSLVVLAFCFPFNTLMYAGILPLLVVMTALGIRPLTTLLGRRAYLLIHLILAVQLILTTFYALSLHSLQQVAAAGDRNKYLSAVKPEFALAQSVGAMVPADQKLYLLGLKPEFYYYPVSILSDSSISQSYMFKLLKDDNSPQQLAWEFNSKEINYLLLNSSKVDKQLAHLPAEQQANFIQFLVQHTSELLRSGDYRLYRLAEDTELAPAS